MKNDHLVPPAVLDIIEKFNGPLGENERLALLQRLEVIRDVCQKIIDREDRKKKWK